MKINSYIMFLLMGSSISYNIVLLYILMKIKTGSIVFLVEPNELVLGFEILFLFITLLFWIYFSFNFIMQIAKKIVKKFINSKEKD